MQFLAIEFEEKVVYISLSQIESISLTENYNSEKIIRINTVNDYFIADKILDIYDTVEMVKNIMQWSEND